MAKGSADRELTKPSALSVDASNFPKQLTDLNQWILWGHRLRKQKDGTSRWTKVPLQISKREARSNDPKTWRDFATVLRFFSLPHNRRWFDGVGFVFSKHDGFFGVDMDACRDPQTGRVTDWASEIIDGFGTYTEVSPSGYGIKLIGRGRLAVKNTGRAVKLSRDDVQTFGDKDPEIACYQHGRYWCLTGDMVGDLREIIDCQDTIDALFEKWFPAKSDDVAATQEGKPQGIDGKLMQKLLAKCRTDGDRSKEDFNLCCTAVKRNWDREQVWKAVKDIGKFAERGRDYFDTTWTNAANESSRRTQEAADGLNSSDLELCKSIQIDVLGEREGGSIVVFGGYHRKLVEIRDVDRFTYAKMLQAFGPPARDRVHEAMDDIAGMFSVGQVRKAIASLAGFRRIDDQTLSGVGIWPAGKNIVAVGAGEAVRWNGSLERVTKPRCGGRLLDLSTGSKWFDYDVLKGYLDNYSTEWAIEAISKAVNIFDRWRWRNDTDPVVLAGLVLASYVQTVWSWRPHVAITGQSNCGKSILFDAITALYGPICVQSSKSSAAGIRQSIQRSAKVLLIDEFEKSKHRKEILEMVRAGNRGDTILMGTTDQRGMEFRIRHMIWLAAVELGLSKAADRNRFITLDLKAAEPGKEGDLVEPPEQECRDLGQKLIAIAIRSVSAAKPLAVRLKAEKHPGVDSRIIESYAVPAAMLAVARNKTDEQAAASLAIMLAPLGESAQVISDEEDLIQDILSHIIRYDKGEEATVSQLIQNLDHGILEMYGIAISGGRPGPRSEGKKGQLFLDPRTLKSTILKGTQWEDQAIEQLLKRIEGAEHSRRRIASRMTYGIAVPLSLIDKRFLSEGEEF